ncbi:MAG: MBL fold metallo-hydrolase [Solirubrobacteraceae bacterium]
MSLTVEVAPGVYWLPVPTPFALGDVNCYLLTGSPLTLVDTGLNWGTALDRLELSMAELGLRIEDLELVTITHQHVDHAGLIEFLQRRSGAEVAAFDALLPWLADEQASAKSEREFAATLLRQHGVPEDVVTVLEAAASNMSAYGSPGTVTLPLHDGSQLTMGGRQYEVYHRPGHSPSDLVFLDPERHVLLGGDHLIAHISSNALVTKPISGSPDAWRPKPLLSYRQSLQATRKMPIRLLLAGHGEPIQDHVALIDRRLSEQRRRARKILGLLADGPRSAHALSVSLWGRAALTQTYLTVSETLGHLDLLIEDGSVSEAELDGVSVFSASP